MNAVNLKFVTGISALALFLSSCASMEQVVSAPVVNLRNVQVTSLDFSRQTFLLNFDVTNPNAFALPVNEVSYGVELDGFRFASGAAPSAFTVPARSDTEFSISVELDLLKTGPQLLFILREGAEREIPYELSGSLEFDIPFTRAAEFRATGQIRLGTMVTRVTK